MITTDEGISEGSYLSTQLRLLQVTLMWPIRCSGYTAVLVHVYFWCIAVCLSVCTFSLTAKVFITSDLVDRSEAIDILTLVSTGLFKMVYFSAHHGNIKFLVDFADTKFPKRPSIGNSNLLMTRWMRWCGPLSALHCLTAFTCISFWGVCPILNVIFGVVPLSKMNLPMNVWYPFDFTPNSIFIPFYFIHYFGLISSTHVYMSCDGFFFSLIHLVNGQIEIIKSTLKEIKNVTPKDNETVQEAKYSLLKSCVIHHNNVMLFLRKLDMEFRTMILADVLHAIISLSFAMFQTSESKGFLEYVKMFSFVCYCFLHQYLNSLFGQTLINQQEGLREAMYEVDWADEPQKLKKSLQIMMCGSIRPIRFSAWSMYYLQYETFLEFVKTMVSCFMVLRTLREQGLLSK